MRIFRKAVTAAALGSLIITQTGCFGTFELTRKVYEFHDGVTDNKFVKSLLYWIPGGLVYMVAGAADTVIFNLIEFWSGTNPLSMNDGEHEMQLTTIGGVDFKIEANRDRFTTTQLSGDNTGEVRIMKFDRSDMTWKYTDSKVCDKAVLGFLDEQGEQVRLYTDAGSIDMAAADLQNKEVLMAKLSECRNGTMAAAH
jgi:hypothetical protein